MCNLIIIVVDCAVKDKFLFIKGLKSFGNYV